MKPEHEKLLRDLYVTWDIGVMTIKGPYRSFCTFKDRYEAAT